MLVDQITDEGSTRSHHVKGIGFINVGISVVNQSVPYTFFIACITVARSKTVLMVYNVLIRLVMLLFTLHAQALKDYFDEREHAHEYIIDVRGSCQVFLIRLEMPNTKGISNLCERAGFIS